MTPEAKARKLIDQKLEQAGWVIQDLKQFDLSVGRGVVVRKYPTDTGEIFHFSHPSQLAEGLAHLH